MTMVMMIIRIVVEPAVYVSLTFVSYSVLPW